MAATFSTKHYTVHEAICDAVLRNGQGIDDNDVALMKSAFTEDAVQDMSACSFLNPHFGLIEGRDAVVSAASNSVGKMITTHMMSNFRTQVSEDGKSAHLTCYALAQHWRPGHGKSYAFANNFLMGNRYEGDLVFDGELWRLKRFVVRPQWTQGDFGVFDMNSWATINEAAKAGL